ncbi:hypothetical protein ABIQ69_03655 [Agromyces sp. G08B096]|uniref:Lipoprotein n=1 Tax=Agromyces sp. G08B096 TaxID=3156399 RepID=A0AAU7W9P9_9MICO
MQHSRLAAIAIVAAIGLAGCTAQSMESDLLRSAFADATLERRAVDECNSTLGGHRLLAAIESPASEVRQVGTEVQTVEGWADALPVDEETFAAICIIDAEGVPGVRGDPDYIAFWVSKGSTLGASGIITAWARDSR